MTSARFIKRLLLAAVQCLLASASTWAQCAMCKANVVHAQNAAEVSQTINAAVLVLLVPTLLIIGGLIKLVCKYRHSPSDNEYVHLRSADAQRNSQ